MASDDPTPRRPRESGGGRPPPSPAPAAERARACRSAIRQGMAAAADLLLEDEDLAAYETLLVDLVTTLGPANEAEARVVHRLAGATWELGRCRRLEADLRAHVAAAEPGPDGRPDWDTGAAAGRATMLTLHGEGLEREVARLRRELRRLRRGVPRPRGRAAAEEAAPDSPVRPEDAPPPRAAGGRPVLRLVWDADAVEAAARPPWRRPDRDAGPDEG